MTEENKHLIEGMVRIANAYKNAVEVLEIGNGIIKHLGGQQGVTIEGKPIEFDSVILSKIVLVAIDIEILLKAINLADNDAVGKDHDWTRLFGTLPPSRQQEIKNAMPQQFQKDFDALLDNNKDAFVRWRYSYEFNNLTCNWTFIHSLANVLAVIAINLAKQNSNA